MSESPQPEDQGAAPHLLIGTDAGVEPIIRAALDVLSAEPSVAVLVLLGVDDTRAFKPRPSTIIVPGMPAGVIACVPQLDEFGVASRLASTGGLPGCHDGPVTELAELWLNSLSTTLRARVQVTASGAESTLIAVTELAQRFGAHVTTMLAQDAE